MNSDYKNVIGDGESSSAATTFVDLLTFTPSGTTGFTTSTFTDIAGMSNQTISIPKTGNYILELTAIMFGSSAAYAQAELDIYVDNASSQVLAPKMFYQVNIHASNTFSKKVSLAVGSHSFRPRWRLANATGALNTDSSLVFTLKIIGTD